MVDIIWSFIGPFLSGAIVGAFLLEHFWNKTQDDLYELGYKHGKQRGDAEAFLEKLNQQYKD